MRKETAKEKHLQKQLEQLRKENKYLKEQIQTERKDAFRYHDELLMLRRKYEVKPEKKTRAVAIGGVGSRGNIDGLEFLGMGISGAGKTSYNKALMEAMGLVDLINIVSPDPPPNASGPTNMDEYISLFKKDYPTQDK